MGTWPHWVLRPLQAPPGILEAPTTPYSRPQRLFSDTFQIGIVSTHPLRDVWRVQIELSSRRERSFHIWPGIQTVTQSGNYFHQRPFKDLGAPRGGWLAFCRTLLGSRVAPTAQIQPLCRYRRLTWHDFHPLVATFCQESWLDNICVFVSVEHVVLYCYRACTPKDLRESSKQERSKRANQGLGSTWSNHRMPGLEHS